MDAVDEVCVRVCSAKAMAMAVAVVWPPRCPGLRVPGFAGGLGGTGRAGEQGGGQAQAQAQVQVLCDCREGGEEAEAGSVAAAVCADWSRETGGRLS